MATIHSVGNIIAMSVDNSHHIGEADDLYSANHSGGGCRQRARGAHRGTPAKRWFQSAAREPCGGRIKPMPESVFSCAAGLNENRPERDERSRLANAIENEGIHVSILLISHFKKDLLRFIPQFLPYSGRFIQNPVSRDELLRRVLQELA